MSICMYANIMVRFTLGRIEEDEDNRIDEYPIKFQLDDIKEEIGEYLQKNVTSMCGLSSDDVKLSDVKLSEEEDYSNNDVLFVQVLIPLEGNYPTKIEKGMEEVILRMGHNAKILKD